jgi:2,4-dienoyl-CoA reductase
MLRTAIRTKAYKTMPQAVHYPVKSTPMLPAGTFDGKVAFITGGGTGLGKGMATVLSHLGATVAITGRREVEFEVYLQFGFQFFFVLSAILRE